MKWSCTLAATFFAFLIAVKSGAQNSRLFWYEGKKIKPNVLVTLTGDTVVYTPAKGLLKISAGKNSGGQKFGDLQRELTKTPQRIAEMIRSLSGKVPTAMLPVLSGHVRKGYQDVSDQFGPLLSNAITLPDEGLAPIPAKTKGPLMREEEDYFELFQKGTAEVLERCAKRASEEITFVPAPPRRDLRYTEACDAEAKNRFKREMEVFLKELGGEDSKLNIHVLGISRQANFLLTEKENGIIQSQLKDAQDLLLKVAGKKIRRLLADYGDDPYRVTAILEVMFSLDRQNQLIGGIDLSPYYGDGFQKCYDALVRFFRKAMAEKDFAVVLNHPLLFSFNRQCHFLGWPSPEKLITEILAFDRFKMDVHISAKISDGGNGFQLAELKGENWFFASPFDGCRLQWSLMGPQLNKLTGKLVETDWRGNGATMTYAGPATWYGEIPKMRMDFCRLDEALRDTVEIYQFDAENDDEKWNIPQVGVTKLLAVNNCLMTCFIDAEKVKEEARNLKQNPAEIEKMKAQMLKQYKELMKNNKLTAMPNTNDYSLEALQMVGRLQQNSRRISEMIHPSSVGKYVFEPDVYNKTDVIVDTKLDGKELFPQNAATEYAHFFLKITHDPKGPFGL